MKSYFSLKLLVILFLFYGLTNCSGSNFTGKWYLEGEDLLFHFKNEQLIITEKEKLVIKAKKITSRSKDDIYKIFKIGKKSKIFQKKYYLNQKMCLSQPIFTNNEITLYIESAQTKQKYLLSQSKKEENLSFFSLLHPIEKKEFLMNKGFVKLNHHFSQRVISTNLNDKNLSYLIDSNNKTSWHYKGLSYFFDDFFEFFFYNNKGKKLHQDVKIMGIGFVVSASERNNFKDLPLFHRIKKIVLQFSKNYEGGIGRSRSHYTNKKFEITLRDESALQIIYFYKPIFCKSIRMKIKDIYPGLFNEIRLNEVIFYLLK